VITDTGMSQINAFHPGAMGMAHCNSIAALARTHGKPALAIISPDSGEAMVQHARDCVALEVPFLFDPGQAMPLFDGAALRNFIEGATYLAANDYETSMMCERTGWSVAQIAERVEAMFITHGAEGSSILTREETIEIPAIPASEALDPTGCGDAYRAGILYGLQNGLDWITTGRLAGLMGTIKVEHRGPQNHAPSRAEIAARFAEHYGPELELELVLP